MHNADPLEVLDQIEQATNGEVCEDDFVPLSFARCMEPFLKVNSCVVSFSLNNLVLLHSICRLTNVGCVVGMMPHVHRELATEMYKYDPRLCVRLQH